MGLEVLAGTETRERQALGCCSRSSHRHCCSATSEISPIPSRAASSVTGCLGLIHSLKVPLLSLSGRSDLQRNIRSASWLNDQHDFATFLIFWS